MLQLVLHLPPHGHLFVAMQQQLPQIALLQTRHPQLRKAVFQQQRQQQFGIAPVGLLLAHLQGPDLGGVAQPQLVSQSGQHALEPQGVAARLHADDYFPLQLGVKLLGLSRIQLAFHVLPGFGIEHSNLLETRMEITAYNLHDGSFRPSLGLLQAQAYSALVWSRRCYEIKRANRGPQRAPFMRLLGWSSAREGSAFVPSLRMADLYIG